MTKSRSPTTVGVDRGPPPQSELKRGNFLAILVGDRHFCLPFVMSIARTDSPFTSSLEPMMKSVLPTMAGPPYPIPASVEVQSNLGPFSDQGRFKPVSVETPSRLGPRH